jgi:hypothetical protein
MVKRMKPGFITAKPAPGNRTSDDLLKVVANHYSIDEALLRSNREAFDANELLHQACLQVCARQVIEMEVQPLVESVAVSAPAPVAIVVDATLVSSDTRPVFEPVTEQLTEPSLTEPSIAATEPALAEPPAARRDEVISEPEQPVYTGPDYLQPIYVQSDYAPAESVDPESAHDESAESDSAHDDSGELESGQDASGEIESPLPESPSGSTSTDSHGVSRRTKKRRGSHKS